MSMKRSRVFLYLVFIFLAGIVLAACSSATTQPSMAEANLPDFVMDAPADVKTAYEYAASHPDELAKYPCYCGCGKMGHTSNRSCYIKDIASDGKITFDSHASGCGICVDITKDVMRMK